MASGNTLTDDPAAYTYVPKMVSPISDDPGNPDAIRMWTPMTGTVNSVPAIPGHAGGDGESGETA